MRTSRDGTGWKKKNRGRNFWQPVVASGVDGGRNNEGQCPDESLKELTYTPIERGNQPVTNKTDEHDQPWLKRQREPPAQMHPDNRAMGGRGERKLLFTGVGQETVKNRD